MWEIFTSAYAFWNYLDDAGKLKRFLLTIKMYARFLIFYIEDPEVRLKYSRKYNMIDIDQDTLEKIRTSLVDDGFEFGNITKEEPNEMTFDLRSSRLNYRVYRDLVTEDKMNLKVETNYASYYPIRRFNKLSDVTETFNRICSSISSLYEFKDEKRVIFAEFEINRERKGKKSFRKSSAKIVFDEDGFQINDLYGDDQARFLVFLSTKWLMESKKKESRKKVEEDL